MHLHPGWLLVALGAALVLGGLVWMFVPWIPLGRLPGDIRIEGQHTRVYIPISTCILASLVLSGLFWMVRIFSR